MGKQGIKSTLKKVDAEPEIPEMDKIWDTLYLGEMAGALDKEQLLWYNIKSILTVMEEPIADRSHYEGVAYHWINADDYEEEDLLTHFHEAYDIIDAAVTAKTGVLVHCRAGISRSATIVISYLMRKLQKPYKEVRALVRSRRDCIEPNDGFVDQLLMFESMAYRLAANHRPFRQLMLRLVTPPDNRLMLYYERMSVAEKMTADLDYGPQYVCTGCGEGLFNEIHVLKNDGSDMYKDMKVCGRVFIEPQRWMGWTKVTETIIRCQTCGQLVGRVGPTYPVIDCNCGHHMDVDTPLKVEMTANMFRKSDCPKMSLQDMAREEYQILDEYQDMNQIWDTLYLGSYKATQNLYKLQKHNIRTILTVMDTEIPPADRHPTVKYHYIRAHDIEYQDLSTTFAEAYAIIDAAVTAKTGILVHCAAGISRSATTVISYLMKKLGKPYKEVRDLVEQKRPHIYPNRGFVEQLQVYESIHTRYLEDKDVI